ncbi:LIF receptor subunit alpha a isoform X1 [Hemibagrus wyckioides]|uniref:LIF receptor subunit alpha a isoform X1 n=1 Tax=Hemibagrus wyckioides TaxID=337641 RepID=UPI00266DCFB3|nr:LIF receptor subunit alpha a isoform X1 [Hemibagrus wyckioides]
MKMMRMYTLPLLLLSCCLTPSLIQSELSVPQMVSVQKDLESQTLTLSWRSDASDFDVEIYHTELMELVLNESVYVEADSQKGSRDWSWRSAVPLECTSRSVRIRARHVDTVSKWSPLLTIFGMDVPDQPQAQMYPQDRVLEVGGNVTVCCITPEGVAFSSLGYGKQNLAVTRLSRRSYSATITDLHKSSYTGTNVVCLSDKTILTGTVLFIGYPPGDEGLQCETRDLQSAECRWSKGRDTGLQKRDLLTKYTLNNRTCTEDRKDRKQCRSDRWESSWTLVAKNPLGMVQLSDSAHIKQRIRLLAPVNVKSEAEAWKARVGWNWTVEAYKTLSLLCEVQLDSGGQAQTRNYTGVGLSSVELDSLRPDIEYSFSIRCASLQSFWRWGDWSAPYSLHTHMDRPKAPDVWVWRTSEITGQVVWKSLSPRDSHGALTAYEVSQREGEEDGWKTVSLPPSVSRTPISLSNSSDIVVAVAARNPVGLSQHSTVIVPQYTADSELSVSELVGNGGGLTVSWNHDHNSTQGYVVEWLPSCCPASSSCAVQWERVSSSNTSTVIQSGSLDPGVQYTISIFSLLPEASVLLQRHYGYGQEQVPSVSVGSLSALQAGSDIVLSWTPVPVCQQKGFILGHTVYLADASNLSLIANLTDPSLSSYTVKSLPLGSYKFMVRSYTSAGEGMESTVAIKTESDTNLMLVEILVALGAMSFCFIIISVFCYKKREWVKKAFYPEIPGPKLTGDWSAPPGPLDLKPPPHSLVHIVESPDKEGLVTVPGGQEEGHHDDESDNQDVEPDTDSDEPALLRYYNQLVSDASDRSSSSTDSAQTQVTYTGIQSPAYRPQNQSKALSEAEPQEESPGAGYKPQCSWRPDPESENLCDSLGSPTSVTSSQFLIPESSEEHPESSGSWFQNFLSGKF